MKRFLLLATLVCATLLSGCRKYDDTDVWEKLNDHESRITQLEELCRQMNTNISSLQTLINALNQKEYITNIAPITKNGAEIGYSITFTSGKTITIYHGKDGADGKDGINGENGADGKDGSTPIIGVKKDSDNIYYWTLNGEWLLDDAGNKIKAVGTDGKDGEDGKDGQDGATGPQGPAGENGADGEDGKDGQNGADGKDGITPQLKIEEGYWYISYDNGSSWKQLGKATGENGKDGQDGENGKDGQDGADGKDGKDGDSFFQSVTQDDEYVYFTLADGTQISILKASAISSIEISYVPRYDDGKATVVFTTAEDSKIEMDFQIMPKSAAAIIAKDWENTLSLKAVETQTRAVEYIDMPISKCTVDATNGTITITASGKNLPQTFFDAETKVRAALFYDSAIGGTVSEYIELLAVEDFARLIKYIATEEIAPSATYLFGANIVSNEWDSTTGKGVITFDADVTTIGRGAFKGCSSLTSITIPDSVTTIGWDAFSGCTSLTSVTIGNSVATIGGCAFDGCTSLTSVTIPDSVIEIGNYAFRGCTSLTSVTIGDSVTTIGVCAFDGCTSLTSITIPDSVTTIGSSAFYNCSSLTNVTIPDSVTTIAYMAFSGCSSLASITIPDSVTEIGDYVFRYCSSLTSVTIGDSVTTIGQDAFCDCISLTSITIPDSVTTIGSSAFYNCSSLTSVTIGDSVTTIGSEAFRGCSSLTSVTIGDSVTTIGEAAFYGCENLSHITLPQKIISIEDAAFMITRSLKRIIIPKTLQYMGDYVFNSSGVVSIYFEGITPPEICKETFFGISPGAKIYVPESSVDLYKNHTNWSLYQKHIFSQGDVVENYISSDYSKDGLVTILQNAKIGKGVDIVLMGDGYSDRQIADNTYANKMNEAFNYLFTEEPFKSFKDYFNVYYVNAISKTEGFDTEIKPVLNGSFLYDGYDRFLPNYSRSMGIVKEYVMKALSIERLNDALVIVIMNSPIYTGICYYEEPTSSCGYGEGFAMACIAPGPEHAYWAPILHHEANGHGFAKLADEYSFENAGGIPASEVIVTKQQQINWGWWKNIDFTSDPTATRWNYFINDPRYVNEGLGAYEGGLTYQTGVWRPTENSIMRYNTGGFNAPSREAIYYRIHKLAFGDSWVYDHEEFVEWDARNRVVAATRAMVYKPANYKPTHPPVVIPRSL